MSRPAVASLLLASTALAHPARADDAAATGQQAELAASLATSPKEPVVDAPGAPLAVPPPPPRKKGIVLESSLGALGFTSKMNTVSPIASHLSGLLGYEPFRWAMVFAEADLAFTSTRYANPPPSPRGYAIWGFGGGVRFTVHLTERVAVYAQGDVGGMKASEDILRVYGFRQADQLSAYYGGTGGLEWYQVDRHYALALNGGARRATGFDRATYSSDTALAWTAGAAIRYTF